MSQVRFSLPLWASLLFVVGAPACGASPAVKSLDGAELAKVRGHEAAVVLLRVTTTIDGKPVGARGGDANRQPRFLLANLDELGAPQNVVPPTLSSTAADAGWRYLVLPPGAYFLLLLPPGMEQNPPAVAYSIQTGRYGRLTDYALQHGRGGFWSSDIGAFAFAKSPPPDFQALQGFWFEVPRGREIVYVGSLSVTCAGGRGLFGSLLGSCGDFDVNDESDTARSVAVAALPWLAFETQSLVPYGRLRPGVLGPEPGALPVVAQNTSSLGAAVTGVRLRSSATLHGVGPAFNMFNLLVVGGEMLQRSSEQHKAEQRVTELQPCLARLSATLSGSDVSPAFAAALAAAPKSARANDPAVVASQAGTHRWSVSLPILRLRESGASQGLALELGLVVRLEALATGRLDGYSLWLSGPELPRQSPLAEASPLYLRLVAERAAPRPSEEWCGPAGGELLATEMARALRNIATQVVSDVE